MYAVYYQDKDFWLVFVYKNPVNIVFTVIMPLTGGAESYLVGMLWFNRKKKVPAFPALHQYTYRDQYFIRCAQWRWLNDSMISVIDPHGPRMLTLDPWPQIIFLAADGSRTVSEYIYFTASQYSGKIPELLDQTIVHENKTVLRYGIIYLSDISEQPDILFDKAS